MKFYHQLPIKVCNRQNVLKAGVTTLPISHTMRRHIFYHHIALISSYCLVVIAKDNTVIIINQTTNCAAVDATD